MKPRTLQLLVVMLLSLIAFVAACSVPEDESPRVLGPEVLPVVPTPTPQTSETTQRVIYLFNSETGLLQPVTREVESPVTVASLLLELSEPPTEVEAEENLSTRIPPDTILFSTVEITEDMVMVIDLANSGLPVELEGDNLVRALAQLVFTVTVREDTSAVRLLIEGAPQQWPTTGEGDTTELQPLTTDLYDALNPDFEPPPAPTQVDIVEGETPTPDG